MASLASPPTPGSRAAATFAFAPGRLLDRIPRLVRFALVGATCAIFQLLALEGLVHLRVELHVANMLAFVLSTQLNFALSSLITWRDRLAALRGARAVARRLVGYNALALGSFAINQAVFAIVLPRAPYLVAGACGILAGMLLTYVVSGRVLFRQRPALAGEPA